MNFNCEKCGLIEYAIFDGYAVGEKLLEGVGFKIEIVNDHFKASIFPHNEYYFRGLNKKYWIEKVEDFIYKYDFVECPNCGSDVEIPGE